MARKLKLGSFKAGELIADLREGPLKEYTQEYIPDPLLLKYYNNALYLYYDLSGLKGTDDYTESVIVPIVKSVISNKSTDSAYDSATRILTLPLEGDIIWTNDTEFNDDWAGAKFVITNAATGINYNVQFEEFKETSGGLTKISVTVDAIAPPTIAAANLVVQGSTGADNEADEVDLTRLGYFKYIDRIIRMTSSKAPTVGPDVLSSKAFDSLKSSHQKSYSNYRSSILWIKEGETLRRSKNPDYVPSYGVCTIWITRMPVKMEDDEDYMDCKDTERPNIDKIALIMAVGSLPKDKITTALPADLMSWYNELQASKNAREEEKKKG